MKFGLFSATDSKPSQEYEGDYMLNEGEHITIHRKTVRGDEGTGADRIAASIRLGPGQSVKEMRS